jgi:superfamily II DNA/RNA helicase
MEERFPIIERFEELNLKENLLRGIYTYGFEKPYEIQGKAILPCISHRDLIAQAQSGSGKTGTFCISALQLVEESKRTVQVLIFSPTRELTNQSFQVLHSLSKYIPEIKIVKCIGGEDSKDQKTEIQEGCQIVIGTPGRILDFIQKDIISVNTLKCVILDEVDELLSDSFQLQMKKVFSLIPETVQLAMYSATCAPSILQIAESLMSNPYKILLPKEDVSVSVIKQTYIMVRDVEEKWHTLMDIYGSYKIPTTIIFCNRINSVLTLRDKFKMNGFEVAIIYGELSQEERIETIRKFRLGVYNILISTDLLSRGLDVPQVQLVINYELPPERKIENYIHRIGRSGRAGKSGLVINFVFDDFPLRMIQQYYPCDMRCLNNEDLANLKN